MSKVTSLASQPTKHQSQYTFSATSTSPAVTPIRKRGETAPTAPRVIYTTEAYQTIQYLVAKCDKEVGWLGTVEFDGNDYWITEIFVPEQEVSSVTTEIENDAMAELAHWMMDNDRDPGQLYYWGHSHVNMGVSPSGQDEHQLAEYLDTCSVFIRGIYNKKGDAKVDVFDRDAGVVYQCVQNHPEHDLIHPELKKKLDGLLKDKLVERRYLSQTSAPTNQHQTPTYHNGYGGYSGLYPNYEGGYYTQRLREQDEEVKKAREKEARDEWLNEEAAMMNYLFGKEI